MKVVEVPNPVVYEAHQWQPGESPSSLPAWLRPIACDADRFEAETGCLTVPNTYGDRVANPGDWILMGTPDVMLAVGPIEFGSKYAMSSRPAEIGNGHH
jgi:hypothetical protein